MDTTTTVMTREAYAALSAGIEDARLDWGQMRTEMLEHAEAQAMISRAYITAAIDPQCTREDVELFGMTVLAMGPGTDDDRAAVAYGAIRGWHARRGVDNVRRPV